MSLIPIPPVGADTVVLVSEMALGNRDGWRRSIDMITEKATGTFLANLIGWSGVKCEVYSSSP
jgi:hypothetical protein